MSTWWVEKKDLDTDQLAVIRDLPKDGRFLVSGPPGSGKTNLLMLRAMFLHGAGAQNIKILAFTSGLRAFLRQGASAYGVISPDRIDTCMGWMMRELTSTGGSYEGLSSKFSDRRQQLALRLKQQITARGYSRLHHTLLLDEAQDYTEEEIDLFDVAATNLFMVGDDRQLVHGGSAGLSAVRRIAHKTITLEYHYRNAPEICELADRFAKASKGHKLIKPTCNYTGPPGRVDISQGEMSTQFELILKTLGLQLDSYPNDFLAVLCAKTSVLDAFMAFASGTDVGRHLQRVESGKSWDNACRVVVSTVHSAKGMEFRAVHLPCFEQYKGQNQREIAYTAVTRAKTALDIYHEGQFAGWLADALVDPLRQQSDPEIDSLFGGIQ